MKRKHQKPPKEPHRGEVAPGEITAHLAKLSKPASIREIAHGMGLKHHGRRFLPRIIQELKRRGEIEEIHGGRYRLPGQKHAPESKPRGSSAANEAGGRGFNPAVKRAPPSGVSTPEARQSAAPQRARDPNLISGRIVAHRDGYGFVVPDTPIPGVEGDLFIPRDHIGDAMHGDRVLARIERRRPDGRAEGRVVQITEREHPTVVGLFRYGPHGNVVLPYDTRILHEIHIPPGDELTPALREKTGAAPQSNLPASRRAHFPELDGAVVDVLITRFPKGGLAPAGRVTEILGRPAKSVWTLRS